MWIEKLFYAFLWYVARMLQWYLMWSLGVSTQDCIQYTNDRSAVLWLPSNDIDNSGFMFFSLLKEKL